MRLTSSTPVIVLHVRLSTARQMDPSHGVHVRPIEYSRFDIFYFVFCDNWVLCDNCRIWIVFPIQSTPFVDNWTNIYTQYIIDWIVEDFVILEYYTIHLTSLVFYIGLSLYVGAMHADLKIRLREIHERAKNSSIYNKFQRNLASEIRFHARLYE